MPINIFDDVDKMLFTVFVIITITAVLYKFMGRFNKPMVLGGIVAGAIVTNLHLPKEYFDLDSCSALGNMGIILFMMTLGTRFDFAIVHEKKSNVLVSIFGMLVPFIAGVWFARYLYPLNAEAVSYIKYSQFAVLVGLSMSIAAFALVSLFLAHANLLNRKISHVALLSASSEDVIFWVFFAAMLVYFQTNDILQIGEGIIFTIYMISILFVFPPLIRFIVGRISHHRTMLGFMIVGCFISAVLADSVDLHQVFGGFVFGLMLPRDNKMIKQMRSKIDDFTTVLLLPIFFAKIGALTNISLITNSKILLLGLAATIIAFVGKFIGVVFGSRILGYSNKESMFLASVLNIRGVVEVVMMKIAWEVGLISLQVFTILIIMAIVTTWLASSCALYFKQFLPDH